MIRYIPLLKIFQLKFLFDFYIYLALIKLIFNISKIKKYTYVNKYLISISFMIFLNLNFNNYLLMVTASLHF